MPFNDENFASNTKAAIFIFATFMEIGGQQNSPLLIKTKPDESPHKPVFNFLIPV